jgi:putative transcriptional regulator
MNEPTFENKISYWIKEKGLIQRHVARKLNVSEQTFSKWCKNVTQPDLHQAYLIAEIMNIKVDDLCNYK